MANNNQIASSAIPGGDQTYQNYGGTDIPSGSVVLFDAANLPAVNLPAGVVLPTAAGAVTPVAGITMEILKAGKAGRVRYLGTAACVIEGAVSMGDFVQAGNTVSKLGRCKKSALGTSIGIALAPGVDGDTVPVQLGLNGASQVQVGSAVLVAGAATVATGITITASSQVLYARSLLGGPPGHLSYALVVGGPGVGSIVFTSSSGTDTSTLVYEIVGLGRRARNTVMAKNKSGAVSMKSLDANGNVIGSGDSVDFAQGTFTMRAPDGRLVTMDLGQGDVHIEKALANYAAGYRLQQGMADMVSPVLPASMASDKFFQWDKNDAFQPVQDITSAPGGTVKEVNPRLSNTLFATVNYAVGAFIPTEVIANADSPLQPQINAMRRCMNVLLQQREQRVANLLTTAANFDPSVVQTTLAANKWDGGAGSNPISDIFYILEKSLQPVTHMVMNERVWHSFISNAQVQKYTQAKYNVPGLPGQPADIQGTNALLGLPTILVAGMKGLTAAGIYDYIWGNDVAFVHQEPNPPTDGQTIATSFTFRWAGGNTQDATLSGGFMVRSFFNQFRGPRGGTQIVVTHNDAEVVTSNIVGGVLKAVYQ